MPVAACSARGRAGSITGARSKGSTAPSEVELPTAAPEPGVVTDRQGEGAVAPAVQPDVDKGLVLQVLALTSGVGHGKFLSFNP